MRFNKELLKGNTTTLVLNTLVKKPMYGYQLLKELEEQSEGIFKFSQGTLYPLLYNMENKKLIVGKWRHEEGKRDRKYYHITAEGERALERNLREWKFFARGMNLALGGVDG